MSHANTLINHLEANAREELAAQDRFMTLLDEQERAIVSGRAEGVVQSSKSIEAESAQAARRAASRQQILKGISNAWQVPVTAMTLGSIAERAGAHGQRLADLRSELRSKTSDVIRKNRQVSAVARLHHHVIREVIGTIFSDDGSGFLDENASGNLIDAEA